MNAAERDAARVGSGFRVEIFGIVFVDDRRAAAAAEARARKRAVDLGGEVLVPHFEIHGSGASFAASDLPVHEQPDRSANRRGQLQRVALLPQCAGRTGLARA